MTDPARPDPVPQPVVSDQALQKAQLYIEEEEGAANRLTGWLAAFITLVAVGTSLFHLYAAYAIVPTQLLRSIHVGLILFLSFLLFPVARRFRHRVMWWDWIAALLAIALVAYVIVGGDDFNDRNTTPNPWDVFFGIALILLVLEAMRRTTGWIMPAVTSVFVLYALFGAYLPAPWTH
ncbi:MAG: C4-dicarboxylate ABC transporter permease, partial [Ramlibacter sp.]|nr:C4-dicarboxylate ABC transporter permease [Ramlibacter sp.]